MALLFTESFDWTTTTANLPKKWSASNSTTLRQIVAGRTGNAFNFTYNGGSIAKLLSPSSNVGIFGFAIKVTGACTIFTVKKNSTTAVSVSVDGYGRISCAGVLSATNISLSEWFYIELKVDFVASGTLEIRVNNETWITTSGNFAPTGVNGFNVIELSAPPAYNGTYWDDIYVCDGSGSYNNDFLGDLSVQVLRPDGDSSPLQWTPSTGSTHYTLVDEASLNTADYVSNGTPGDRDQYTMSDLTVDAAIIHAVAHNVIADKDDAGDRELKTYVKSGASEAVSAVRYLAAGTPLNWQQIVEVDPATSSTWSSAGVDAMEVGVETV